MQDDTKGRLVAEQTPGDNAAPLGVGELALKLKRVVEGEFGHVRLRGEISGYKRVASGHAYLSLKDDSAVIDGVIWKGQVALIPFQPQDGIEVIATGKVTTYPGRSKYQIVIERMELAGEGQLMALLEKLKAKLAGEGLFDNTRKKVLPYLPRVIGVITSPTGAVIRDILHRLEDRCPTHVIVWPVKVQGDGAAAEVAAALRGFDAIQPGGPVPRPDLVIVARGGGSIEDLWAFNEEVVVRGIAACSIPVISAVGHETDTTLADYAADLRAPTPTAAAEMAVPVRAELELAVRNADLRLLQALSRGLADRRKYLDALARALIDPQSLLGTAAQRLDVATERLGNGITTYLRQRAADAAARAARLTHPRHLLVAKTRELTAQDRALDQAMATVLERQRGRQERLAARLRPQLVAAELRDGREKLGRAAADLDATLARRLRTASDRLEARGRLLESFSFKKVLERGFVVVRDAGERPITLASATEAGQAVALEFRDGKVSAVVGATAAKRPAPTTRPTKPMDQGSLL
ncbi:MAG: exodeoxyribonuclease VII large subunit [Alphaproteobacteria bacterium]|nr:exodeoxyribonuclease VII large subunit [Alphaproteobacteria bacterium]